MTTTLKNLEIVETDQKIFDGFNDFILSSDIKVFGKLLARSLLLNEVKDLTGDIVECGVFKGTGVLSFLKMKRYMCPNSNKKVIGFDFFNSRELIETLRGNDKECMTVLFNERHVECFDDYLDKMKSKIRQFGFGDHEYELVKGDICKTSYEFAENNPGFRISLLYMDVDLDQPTYDVLSAFWDRVVKGGIVVFDEYAFHKWSEANGVDRFFKDKDVTVQSLNYICPTAYVRKK